MSRYFDLVVVLVVLVVLVDLVVVVVASLWTVVVVAMSETGYRVYWYTCVSP